MGTRRPAGTMVSAAALFIACLAPALSQSPEPGLQVQSLHPGTIETKPLNTITLVFRAVNRTEKSHEFSPRVELPEGWKLVMDEAAFKLADGEEAIRLVSVAVPGRALVGDYRIGYAVSAIDDPAVTGRAEAEVKVLLEARLAVEAMDIHQLAVAGDKGQSEFLVTNMSNSPLDVTLDVKSNGPGVSEDTKRMRLEAGESRPVRIAVSTDPHLSQRLNQQVQLTAAAEVPEKGPIAASSMTEFEVIPRVSGTGDYFNRLPAEIGFLAIGESGAQGYSQFRFAGSGALDSEGNDRLDFSFRGPGRSLDRDLFYQFGLLSEEYRLSYDSPNIHVHAGDGVYSLTRLTETGNYGRGLDIDAAFDKWSVRGYVDRLLLQNESGDEKAFQLGYKPDDLMKFSLSYMTRKDPEQPTASQIVSLQSQFIQKFFHLNLEYSWDWSGGKEIQPANSALWLEAGETYKNLSSQVNIIRSGPDYHGYYENLDYNSAEVTYAGSERWGVRASFQGQKSHAAIEPYVQPFDDQTIQAGAYYRPFRGLSLSLDERIHESQDLSPSPAYDYQDTSLRLGAFTYFGTFGVQNYVDIGRTRNYLTHESESLTEYTLSVNYLAINKISLSAYLHYRDQNESFTGDHMRRLDMNFSVGLQLGRIDISVLYRTAVLRDLYQTALARGDFEDPAFLLNNSDMFGVNFACRFRNGHAVNFRLQNVVNPFKDGRPGKSLLVLFGYSIPVGFPVSRKTSIGMLHGRVYDAEGGQPGVPGVIVKANDLAAVTDAKGDYVFNNLVPGPYVMTLDDRRAGSDMVPVVKMPLTVLVEGGKKLDCPIGLTTGASVGGRVVIYDFEDGGSRQVARKESETTAPSEVNVPAIESGNAAKPQLVERAPLCGTAVELRAGDEICRQVTDEKGRFLFDGLRPGKYTLKVFDDNLPEFHVFEQDTFEVDLKPGAKEEVTIKVVSVIRPIQIIDQGEVKIRKKKDVDK
jgi:hypothetical protein